MQTEDLYRLLRTSHVEAQAIVDTISDPLLVLDANLQVQNASRSFFGTFKVNRFDTIGRHLHKLGDGQWDIPALRTLLLDVIPKTTAVIDYEVEHDFPDLGRRKMLVTARRLFHSDNALHSLLLTLVDVTERSKRDAEKDLQLGEALHRVKNLLSLVKSIANHTATEGRSAKEYRDDFLGRFDALVAAQAAAFSADDEARLGALVERILAPYAATAEAVKIEPGPAVDLNARAVVALSLVLHELATNAAKYGALSVPGGRVHVGWQTAADELRIAWRESGGPRVSPPTRKGYGTELIQSATTYSLGGYVKQDYRETGLETEIAIPLGAASLR